jgi:hypothetical protein
MADNLTNSIGGKQWCDFIKSLNMDKLVRSAACTITKNFRQKDNVTQIDREDRIS